MVTPASTTQLAGLADTLTEARRRMILALPADGSWGPVPSRSVAERAWWNMIPGIIEHKHCPEDRNEWCLNRLGLALRSHIQESNRS